MGANATLDNEQATHQRTKFQKTFRTGLGAANTTRLHDLFPKSVTIPENRVNENADRSELFDKTGDEKSIERAYRRVVESTSVIGNGFESPDDAVNLNYAETPAVVKDSSVIADASVSTDNSGNDTWTMYPDIRTRRIADPETATNVSENNAFVVKRNEQFGTTSEEDRNTYSNGLGNGESNFSPTIGMYFRSSRTAPEEGSN